MQPTQYELRRMADAALAEANKAFEDAPLQIDWRQRSIEAAVVNGILEATLDKHARRWRRVVWFMGLCLALVPVAFWVGRWTR